MAGDGRGVGVIESGGVLDGGGVPVLLIDGVIVAVAEGEGAVGAELDESVVVAVEEPAGVEESSDVRCAAVVE